MRGERSRAKRVEFGICISVFHPLPDETSPGGCLLGLMRA